VTRGGIKKMALLGKRPSPYYGKNSSNKQREMTVHHYEGQSSAVAKTIKLALMRTTTGNEDPELPLLQRISSLELTAQSSSNRHISTSTVKRRLRESGLHGQIAAKKPPIKDANKKNCLRQETQAMDIRPVGICPLV
jgi:hypothetical protein